MDLKALQWELAVAVASQGLDSLHNPKNLAMALAAEAGTLLHLFKWPTAEESRQTDRAEAREATTDALVEVFLHALRMADELGIDLEQAIAKKLGKSASAAAPASPQPAEPALATAPRAEPARASAPPAEVVPRRAERPASVPGPRRGGPSARRRWFRPRRADRRRASRARPVPRLRRGSRRPLRPGSRRAFRRGSSRLLPRSRTGTKTSTSTRSARSS